MNNLTIGNDNNSQFNQTNINRQTTEQNERATKFFFCIFASVIIFIIILYFFIFHNGFSHNSNDWGNFGSYVGGFGGLLLSISLFYYTYNIDKRTRKENREIRSNENKEQKVFMFLQQYNVIIPKIQQYNTIISNIATSTTIEKGLPKTQNSYVQSNILETEIKSRFKISIILASSLNLSKLEITDLTVNDIEKTLDKWINEIIKTNSKEQSTQ